jgi:DNA-binding FadR family transcriptional regulator
VSRPTLREALRVLEAESMISVGRGMRSGALVLGPSVQKAAEYANFMLVSEGVTMGDVHEARMFFEPAIVRSLKGRARADAIAHLRECVDSMKAALAEQRYHDVVSGTNRFHEALARASGNRALALLVRIIQSISDDTYATILSAETTAHADSLQKNMAKTVAGYVALCDLLQKGKTDEAASFWTRYMERSLDFLKRSKLGNRKLMQRSPRASAGTDRAGQ